MQITPEHNERMAKMTFSSVYPHYVTKVEKKGRTKVELQQVISRREHEVYNFLRPRQNLYRPLSVNYIL